MIFRRYSLNICKNFAQIVFNSFETTTVCYFSVCIYLLVVLNFRKWQFYYQKVRSITALLLFLQVINLTQMIVFEAILVQILLWHQTYI